jgi:hypothetical protein
MVSVPRMWTPLERRSTDIVAALAFRSRFEHFGGLTRLGHFAEGAVMRAAILEKQTKLANDMKAPSTSVNAHAISDLAFSNYHAVRIRKPRCSSRF